jgi:hypothetical protein
MSSPNAIIGHALSRTRRDRGSGTGKAASVTGRAVLARHALAELLVGGALGSIEAIELGTVRR